jgi:hypothetical protein
VFSDSSTWLGIDGSTNTSLIQTGTEQGWNPGSSSAFYDAWFEILPADPTEIVEFNVSPGDNIYASVSQISGSQWSIYLDDLNTGQTISQTQTYNGPQASAEFIQEAPRAGSVLPLAHYSQFAFYNARVNGRSPNLNAIRIVDMVQNGAQVSTPSNPDEARNAFTVAYGSNVPPDPPTPVFQRREHLGVDGRGLLGWSVPGLG